jgi:NadR type nicotinamide-nucleotide adenylyltransferase
MLKIVLTGPESTGKTTLAQQLARHFGTIWVPEFARSYLDDLHRPYEQHDLLEIAKGQVELEESFSKKANGLLFLDTSLEVIKVWSEVRYGRCHPWILEQCQQRRHDLYLLCQPDVPWAFDPQRENPGDREFLFEIYRKELTALNAEFVELAGVNRHRFQNAVNTISIFLKS